MAKYQPLGDLGDLKATRQIAMKLPLNLTRLQRVFILKTVRKENDENDVKPIDDLP